VAPAIEMQKFFRAAAWPISLAAMISPRGWLAAVFLAALSAPAAAEEVCGTAIEVPAAETRAFAPFAERLGLKYPRAAVGTISHVHATGRLPDCYLTKRAAEERGWHPGADLWRRAPGHSIGGDSFGNREGLLPARNRYIEADLDYAGGRRGAARLIFVRESKGRWLMWVTTDHYRSFQEVPAPR
jgi:ribonuclease T1